MYQKSTRGTVLFVPFKRKGKYNPSLARFCILLALLVLSCTMSHLQMMVSDDGWKVALIGPPTGASKESWKRWICKNVIYSKRAVGTRSLLY
ncbi:MAG: hypothetical protein CL678_13945 [Bdellovibrionaceae bacterium]|nr:hypothetical protein [Pseudobdellovibrionaceae bacterium]